MKTTIVTLLAFFSLNCPAWAQKAILLCSGTFHTPGMPPAPTTETMVIDYGLRTVTGPIGSPYSIDALNETKIKFTASYLANDGTPMAAKGEIDRVSGHATITVKEQKPEPFWILYAFECSPSKAAF